MFPGAYVGALIAGIGNGAHSGLPYLRLVSAQLLCAYLAVSGGGSRVHSFPALGVGSQLTRLSLPCWGLTNPDLSLWSFIKLIFSIDTPSSDGQFGLRLVCQRSGLGPAVFGDLFEHHYRRVTGGPNALEGVGDLFGKLGFLVAGSAWPHLYFYYRHLVNLSRYSFLLTRRPVYHRDHCPLIGPAAPLNRRFRPLTWSLDVC